MKRMLALAFVALVLSPTMAIADGLRHGVVMQIKPIDNRGDDESDQHKEGRKWGRGVGAMLSSMSLGKLGGGTASYAAGRAMPEAGDAIGGKIAGQGPSAHFMVSVKLDDGHTLSLVQPGDKVNGLGQGSRVAISGTGNSAVISAE